MRHFSFDDLTFARLDPEKIEVVGGSRPRLVMKHDQTNQRYFLKSYRHNTREVWSEMLASQLGEQADIRVQAVSLKKIPVRLANLFIKHYGEYLPMPWVPVGALVRNVFPKGHEILYGAQIIGTASDPVTLEFVAESIKKLYLDSEDLLQAFADMIVFDAWIGNMDRHHENWAIHQKNMAVQFSLLPLTKEQRAELKKLRGFTPLFDHGSSLLFELSEENVCRYLDSRDIFRKSYILGKKYALILNRSGEKTNIFSIIQEEVAAGSVWGRRFRKSISKITNADSLFIARVILQMPTGGELDYSLERKKLLYYSLDERRSILEEVVG